MDKLKIQENGKAKNVVMKEETKSANTGRAMPNSFSQKSAASSKQQKQTQPSKDVKMKDVTEDDDGDIDLGDIDLDDLGEESAISLTPLEGVTIVLSGEF